MSARVFGRLRKRQRHGLVFQFQLIVLKGITGLNRLFVFAQDHRQDVVPVTLSYQLPVISTSSAGGLVSFLHEEKNTNPQQRTPASVMIFLVIGLVGLEEVIEGDLGLDDTAMCVGL